MCPTWASFAPQASTILPRAPTLISKQRSTLRYWSSCGSSSPTFGPAAFNLGLVESGENIRAVFFCPILRKPSRVAGPDTNFHSEGQRLFNLRHRFTGNLALPQRSSLKHAFLGTSSVPEYTFAFFYNTSRVSSTSPCPIISFTLRQQPKSFAI
ncbi:hypothetical protein BDZ85DRAFT_58110 [Elsinoe ampelina]|uniref:Uncharacterized protein n=1 Tax=Elsinoe ampelina TaxID=302913 RepID=A0A6A6GNK1_9PEZI|nr:hypothetical protein BDZ85DRAFT_58110 [Elsinoe ampelina]